MMLAMRRLFVRAKTDMKAKSALASTCRPIGSVSAQAGRKKTAASAGSDMSVSVSPVVAFHMLIPMPSAKNP
jgi:hypothetical protein